MQSYHLDCDHKMYYADKNEIKVILRKRINIFIILLNFLDFFNIDKKYEDILIKFIPPYLFYSIDNYIFEGKISSLLSKIK